MEKYEASIDFSNACRSFYFHRVNVTESFKEKLHSSNKNEKKNTSSLENALLKLKAEMASLMDQDLSLMEQLLTMNESVEEIKSRRLYGVSKESLEQSLDTINSSEEDLSS
ncbi:hypothetical protein KUTeg_016167 [Tegillarca granosa]|uniref:Uncharacterized protein n=1 Tax=Tegillarca granosa TaxID=220873 RepID=A0ABQ9EPU3_TEGGR|nr:hypothetical protein KUTeg_016167 [Tegillarca granosa]